jgi:argininosuccinate synthase
VTDVNGVNPLCPFLKKNLSETTGRGSGVQAPTRDENTKLRECNIEFLSSTGDKVRAAAESNLSLRFNLLGGF